MLRILTLVSLGGVIGSVTRAVIEDTWPHDGTTIGWATLVINTSGCLLIGVLLGAIGRYRPQQELLRPFLGVGVLGGYTTFSTHIVEVQQLLHNAEHGRAVAYLGLQLSTALAAVVFGSWLIDRRPAR